MKSLITQTSDALKPYKLIVRFPLLLTLRGYVSKAMYQKEFDDESELRPDFTAVD